jgi:hypothetical protein
LQRGVSGKNSDWVVFSREGIAKPRETFQYS